MSKPIPPSTDRGEQVAPHQDGEGDDNPLRDYGFAVISLVITATLVTVLFPASAIVGEPVSALDPTWLLSLVLGCWLALWICLQTLWAWSGNILNIV